MGARARNLMSKTLVTEVRRQGLADCCWGWRGAHDRASGARVKSGGKKLQVRRLMLEATGEPLTRADEAIALCGCSSCVNPSHLLRGNTEERHAFGRHGRIDLGTLSVVKQMLAERTATEEDLARNLSISQRLLQRRSSSVQ